jgi:hypothetical protein
MDEKQKRRNCNVYLDKVLMDRVGLAAMIEKRSFSAMCCILIEAGLEAIGKPVKAEPATAVEYGGEQLEKIEGGQDAEV